ncbi:unnamed protein product, partial [Prunus armeniaca]
VVKLQDDNRALDRLTKSKEAALVEAERTVQIAMVKASLVDDLQNKNQELMKQIEICQEENKILDKMHRQKVAEVEKLTQTVRELEEAVLAGGAAANAVRDYQRKVQEMNEEKKLLEREVARAKVSANRVATVVANEWKDSSDKVMPGEMQQLRDKLAVAERTAKAEAQLKEKYQLRFKVLEEKFKASNGKSRPSSDARIISNGPSRRQSLGGAENFSRASSNGYLSRTKSNLQSGFNRSNTATAILKQAKSSSRSFDGGSRLLDRDKLVPDATGKDNTNSASDQTQMDETIGRHEERANGSLAEQSRTEHEDYVSGVLYDMLQKEVVSLRKACHEKDQTLKDKDDAIEMLAKKVDTLNKAMEVEAKKMRREVAAMEKEVSAMRVTKEPDQRARRSSAPRGVVNSSHTLSSRSFDGGSRLLDRDKLVPDATGKDNTNSASDQTQMDETIGRHEERANGSLAEQSRTEHEDYVSGVLYDMLQKEVVSLRKACHEKDQTLKDKDDAIEMLAKKVDTLNKAMEVEAKKMRREVAAMEKEVSAMRVTKEPDQRARRSSAPRGVVNSSHTLSSRNAHKSR